MEQIWVPLLISIIRPTQGLEHTVTAEILDPINFTVTKKKFCLSLHYNGASSYLFVNGKNIVKFKAKDSEIVASTIILGNISKDWSADNMKITGLNEYVYEFNVDYRTFNSPNFDKATLRFHKYFMVKYGKYKMF